MSRLSVACETTLVIDGGTSRWHDRGMTTSESIRQSGARAPSFTAIPTIDLSRLSGSREEQAALADEV